VCNTIPLLHLPYLSPYPNRTRLRRSTKEEARRLQDYEVGGKKGSISRVAQDAKEEEVRGARFLTRGKDSAAYRVA
jgi:hypothetical protein